MVLVDIIIMYKIFYLEYSVIQIVMNVWYLANTPGRLTVS